MKKLLLAFIIFSSFNAYCQQLSGLVTDINNIPLSGAIVTIINTNYSAITGNNGHFNFESIPYGRYTLFVTHESYNAKSQEVEVKLNNNNITINLIEANRSLNEVMITSQKTEQLLQDVPASVSYLSASEVKAYRLLNLKDITAIVPNLYSSNPGDNRNITAIRGITNTSYEPAVATYIDGVNQFSLDTYIPQLMDIERIEVLRGPQGTLYGRNAMGGVINIVTKQPSNQLNGFAEVEAGNYTYSRYNIGLRSALIHDKLFFGAAAQYTGFGGFYTNNVYNNKLDRQHQFLGNYYLKFLPSANLSFALNVKNYANRNYGPFALAASPEDALKNLFTISQNATTKMIDDIINISLSAGYKARGYTLNSQSAYQKNYRYYTTPIDGDFSALDAVSIINNYGNKFNKVEVFTQELRISSPATATRFTWTSGLYGFYRYSPTKTGTKYGADADVIGAPPNTTSINTNTEHNYGGAAFGQLSYQFSPTLEIITGIRYDHEKKKSSVNGAFESADATITTQPDTSAHASFNAVTPKISLLFKPGKASSYYVTYSRGFRAGGLSQLSADPFQVPLSKYQPEFSSNYEAGTKQLLANQKLRFNFSIFFTRINNAQVPTLVLPDAITVIRNTGRLNNKGIELNLQSNIWPWLYIDYNFGYTHSRYQQLMLSSNGSNLDLKGKQQIFTPQLTSMVALQFTTLGRSSSKLKLIWRAEWRLLGKQYFDLGNNIAQNTYSIFNARIGIVTGVLNCSLWANNVLNKRYIDYAYDFGATHLGAPQNYGLTLAKEF